MKRETLFFCHRTLVAGECAWFDDSFILLAIMLTCLKRGKFSFRVSRKEKGERIFQVNRAERVQNSSIFFFLKFVLKKCKKENFFFSFVGIFLKLSAFFSSHVYIQFDLNQTFWSSKNLKKNIFKIPCKSFELKISINSQENQIEGPFVENFQHLS